MPKSKRTRKRSARRRFDVELLLRADPEVTRNIAQTNPESATKRFQFPSEKERQAFLAGLTEALEWNVVQIVGPTDLSLPSRELFSKRA